LYWGRKALVETYKINGNQSLLTAAGPRGAGNLYKDASGNIIDGNYNLNALFSPMFLDNTNQELLSKNDGWRTMKDVIPTNATGQYDPNGTFKDLLFKEFSYGDNAFLKKALLQDYNIGFREEMIEVLTMPILDIIMKMVLQKQLFIVGLVLRSMEITKSNPG